jgi:hypothetical protein
MTRYARLTAGLIAAWFAFTLAASALHVYRTQPGQPPLPLGLAVLIPLAVVFVWFAASKSFREFTLSLNPMVLTMVQSWRVAGHVFLILAAYGILPGLFAQPAGWGDILIGVTAPFVALKLAKPGHRGSFIFWQALGMADLVTAVLMGTLAGVLEPHGVSTSAMTVLPLSLIPAFLVPLFLILHVISIAQARRWPDAAFTPAADHLPSAA